MAELLVLVRLWSAEAEAVRCKYDGYVELGCSSPYVVPF